MEPPPGGAPRELPPALHVPARAAIGEAKPLSKEDQLFFEAIRTKNEPRIAELKDKKLVPSKELILHAIQWNMINVAMRALQANPNLKPEELLAIREQAYFAKNAQLVAATVQKGPLPTAREIETAILDQEYDLLDRLLEPYRAMRPKPNLCTEDGSHLIIDTIWDDDEKAFDLLKDVVDLDVKVGTMSLLEHCMLIAAKKKVCGKLCLKAICNAQERRTQSERNAYAMYLFCFPDAKKAFVKLYASLHGLDTAVKLYASLHGLDTAPKKDDLVFEFISLCGAETRWKALCAPQNCILDLILDAGGGVLIAQMLIQDDPNFEKRDSSGGTLLHHLAAHAAPDVFISLIGWARDNGINLARALDIKRSTDQKTASDLAGMFGYRQIPLDLLRFDSESSRSGNEILQFINAHASLKNEGDMLYQLLLLAQSRGASLLQDANVVKDALKDGNIKILTLIASEQKQKGIKPDYKNCDQNLVTLEKSLQEAHNSLGDEEFAAATGQLLLLVDQFVGLEPLFETEERLMNLLRLCSYSAVEVVYPKFFAIATEKNKKAMLLRCILYGIKTYPYERASTAALQDYLQQGGTLPLTLPEAWGSWPQGARFSRIAIKLSLIGLATIFLQEEKKRGIKPDPLEFDENMKAFEKMCKEIPQRLNGEFLALFLEQFVGLKAIFQSSSNINRVLSALSTELQTEAFVLLSPEPELFVSLLGSEEGAQVVGRFFLDRFLAWEGSRRCDLSYLMIYVINNLNESDPRFKQCLQLFLPDTLTLKQVYKLFSRIQALEPAFPLKALLGYLVAAKPQFYRTLLASEQGAALVGSHLLKEFLDWEGNTSVDLTHLLVFVINKYPKTAPSLRVPCLALAQRVSYNFGAELKEAGGKSLLSLAVQNEADTSFIFMQAVLRGQGNLPPHFLAVLLGLPYAQRQDYLRSLPALKSVAHTIPPETDLAAILFTEEFQKKLSLDERIALYWELGEYDKLKQIAQDLSGRELGAQYRRVLKIEPTFRFEMFISPTAQPQLFSVMLETARGVALIVNNYLDAFLRWDGARSSDLTRLMVHILENFKESDPRLRECLALAIQSDCNFTAEYEPGKTLNRLALDKGYCESYFAMQSALIAQGRPNRNFMSEFGRLRKHPDFAAAFQTYVQGLGSLQRLARSAELGRQVLGGNIAQKLLPEENIAYMWELGGDPRGAARGLPLEEVEKLFIRIRKIEPAFNLSDLIAPELDPAHFARPVPEIRIPKAPPGVDMYDLLKLFDAAAKGGHITESKLKSALKLLVSDKKKEGIEDLRPFLELYLDRVKGRVAFYGTPSAEKQPQELKAYYQKIENALKVIDALLNTEESEQLKADVVVDLAVAGSYCGGRYFKEPKNVYSALRFDPEAASLVGLALVIAQRFRSNIVTHLANTLAAYAGAIGHAEEYISAHLQYSCGVPGPEFPDPFATIASLREPYDDTQLIYFFDEFCKAPELVDTFKVDFNGAKSEQKELFLDWFRDHVPDWYEKELYDPILEKLSTMKQATPEERKQISQFLEENGIASSWTGLEPQDVFTAAKQILSKELRTRVNFHIISLVIDQKKREEAEALFNRYGVIPPQDFTNIALLRNPLTTLIDKMSEEMLLPHRNAIKEMVAQGKSREEIKKYFDGVTLNYTGLIRAEKKDENKKTVKDEKGQTVYEIVPGLVALLTLGDSFPRQKPSPASFVHDAKAQSFINNFIDKNGKFSSGMMMYFLLHNNLLMLPPTLP